MGCSTEGVHPFLTGCDLLLESVGCQPKTLTVMSLTDNEVMNSGPEGTCNQYVKPGCKAVEHILFNTGLPEPEYNCYTAGAILLSLILPLIVVGL